MKQDSFHFLRKLNVFYSNKLTLVSLHITDILDVNNLSLNIFVKVIIGKTLSQYLRTKHFLLFRI